MKKIQFSLFSLVFGILCAHNGLAAPVLDSVAVGPQAPGPISPGESAAFTVTVSRVGSGNIDVYLTISGLPAGAAPSFSPGLVHFTGPSPLAGTSALTISTTSATPRGMYPFTVTGDDGSSHNLKLGGGVLVIGTGVECLQMLPDSSVSLTCSGFPGQSYLIQTTTNLTTPVWTTIATNTAAPDSLFSFIDLGAKSCPCRFYRTAMVQ
jgi:hypothetical protein